MFEKICANMLKVLSKKKKSQFNDDKNKQFFLFRVFYNIFMLHFSNIHFLEGFVIGWFAFFV